MTLNTSSCQVPRFSSIHVLRDTAQLQQFTYSREPFWLQRGHAGVKRLLDILRDEPTDAGVRSGGGAADKHVKESSLRE